MKNADCQRANSQVWLLNPDSQRVISEAWLLAAQLDAVPETGADPDLIVEAACSLRILAAALSEACAALASGQAFEE